MSFNPNFRYEPLETSTSVRILLVAPGEPDDDVYCWTVPSDLDADHTRSPSRPKPFNCFSEIEVDATETGGTKSFTVNFDAYHDGDPETPIRHPYQRYCALSYVWGDPTGLQRIMLNGLPFLVTKNLLAALKNLRIPSIGMRVWIDAICINQADLPEKAAQIRMMKRIYQQAHYVRAQVMFSNEHVKNITLLGQIILKANIDFNQAEKTATSQLTGFGSETAVEEAGSQIGPSSRTREEPQAPPEAETYRSLEDFELPQDDSPLWESWRHLFASPYFTRMWILQEYTLAKKLVFAFGTALADVGFLQLCIDGMLLRSEKMNGLYLGNGSDPVIEKQAIAGFLGGRHMAKERARFHGFYGEHGKAPEGLTPRQANLAQLLSEVHLLSASDPRDKVFALLGLASDEKEFLPLVSYTEPAVVIYTKIAQKLIALGHADDVLRQAVTEVENEEKPTWVPNWGRGAMLSFHQLKPKDFTAGGKGISAVSSPADKPRLHIHGCIIDTISAASLSCTTDDLADRRERLSQRDSNEIRVMSTDGNSLFVSLSSLREPEGSLEMALEFMAAGLTFVLAHSRHMENPIGTFLHTIVQATGDRGPKFAAQAIAFNMVSMAFGYLQDGKPISLLPASVQQSLFGQPGKKPPTHEFLRNAIGGFVGRRFFATSRGMVGLGPPKLKVGDKLVLFYGCKLPFILRRIEQPGQGGEPCYRLAGDCYVDGLMYGEGLGRDGIEEQEFVLA